MPLDNHARAKRALAALRAYATACKMPYSVTDEVISDLVTDLLHAASRGGADEKRVDAIVHLGHLQHRAEREQPALPLFKPGAPAWKRHPITTRW